MAMYKQDNKHLDVVVGAGGAAIGILIEIGGVVGIVDPQPEGRAWAEGELGSATIRGVVEIDNSGVVFADGATVGYDQVADTAVAAAGGTFDCGTCVGGAGATDPVRVLLNA